MTRPKLLNRNFKMAEEISVAELKIHCPLRMCVSGPSGKRASARGREKDKERKKEIKKARERDFLF